MAMIRHMASTGSTSSAAAAAPSSSFHSLIGELNAHLRQVATTVEELKLHYQRDLDQVRGGSGVGLLLPPPQAVTLPNTSKTEQHPPPTISLGEEANSTVPDEGHNAGQLAANTVLTSQPKASSTATSSSQQQSQQQQGQEQEQQQQQQGQQQQQQYSEGQGEQPGQQKEATSALQQGGKPKGRQRVSILEEGRRLSINALMPRGRRLSIGGEAGGSQRGSMQRGSMLMGSMPIDNMSSLPPTHLSETALMMADGWNCSPQRAKARVITSGYFGFDVFASTSFRQHGEGDHDRKARNPLQRLVIEPTSFFSLAWNICEMILLTYDLFAIPLSVFNIPENGFSIFMKYLSVAFWTWDAIVSFFKGYVTKGGEVEMRFSKVMRHYVRTRLAYDLILLSIEWLNVAIARVDIGDDTSMASSGRLLRFLRFSRLLKVGKMRRLIENFLQRIHSNVILTMVSITKVLILILVFTHIVSCFWYFVCDNAGDPNSWIADQSTSPGYRYTTSVSWALTLLGFGAIDIFPVNTWERAYSVVATIACLMAFSYLVSSFVILMTRLQTLQKVQREQEEQLRDFLCKHKVTWGLRNRIWIFLQKTRMKPKKYVQESYVELVKYLPKTVTLEMRAEVFIPVLTDHPFFYTYAVSQADQYAMHHLVETQALEEMALETEHELFADGDLCSRMYFVTLGELTYRARVTPSRTTMAMFGRKTSNAVPVCDAMNTQYDAARGCTLGPHSWLCEPALWLEWCCTGWAAGKTHVEMVALDVEKFQHSMQQSLPEARKYARLYLGYARDHAESLSDVWHDMASLQAMAQDIFEPPTTFDITRCQPAYNANLGRNEWQPGDRRQWQRIWATPYKEAHQLNRSALLQTMTTDLKHDSILVYQTLFSNHVFNFPWPSDEDRTLHDTRVLFLKRLYLLLASCGVTYALKDNGPCIEEWPYPLGSIFSHGGRVLVSIPMGISWKEVLSYLAIGSTRDWNWDEGPPNPIYNRRAATHAIRIDDNGRYTEVKLKNMGTLESGHMGMDLPLGGIGNPTPQHRAGNLLVGPTGVPYLDKRKQQNYLSNVQHGHLYIRRDEFAQKRPTGSVHQRMGVRKANTSGSINPEEAGNSNSDRSPTSSASLGPGIASTISSAEVSERKQNALLFGVESSAPLKDDLFGNTHSVEAKSKDTSAFGKRKWRDYRKGGQEVPGDLGAVRVDITAASFARFQAIAGSLELCKPSTPSNIASLERERSFFRDILAGNQEACNQVIATLEQTSC